MSTAQGKEKPLPGQGALSQAEGPPSKPKEKKPEDGTEGSKAPKTDEEGEEIPYYIGISLLLLFVVITLALLLIDTFTADISTTVQILNWVMIALFIIDIIVVAFLVLAVVKTYRGKILTISIAGAVIFSISFIYLGILLLIGVRTTLVVLSLLSSLAGLAVGVGGILVYLKIEHNISPPVPPPHAVLPLLMAQ